MNKIYIIQHCQSEHHTNELTGGWTDTPLTELGSRQAVEMAKELEMMGLSDDFILYSSDLKRASMTAQEIENHFGVKMILDKSLREHNNGIAANKTKEWAKKNMLVKSNEVELDKPLWESGETFRELYDRMNGFCKRILENTESDIVIVSHGFAIGYLIMSYLNIHCEQIANSFIKGNAGGISVLLKSELGQNTLRIFNSNSYLRRV